MLYFYDLKLKRANDYFYEALIIFENVNDKFGIAKSILKLSQIWAYLCIYN